MYHQIQFQPRSQESPVFKLIYLAMNNISKRWSRPIKNWKAALSHFAILFPERFML
jgi:putative transposase